MSLEIFFAIIAMVSWGTVDFLTKRIVGKVGALRALIYVQIIGLVPVFVYIYFVGIPVFSPGSLYVILLAGLFNAIGYLALFRSLKIGKVSIVSPISATWVLITILLAFLVLGETLTALQYFSGAIIILGILLTSSNFKEMKKTKLSKEAGISMAIIASLGIGIAFFLFKFIVNDLGEVGSLFSIRIVGFLLLLAYGLHSRIEFSLKRIFILSLVAIALLDVAAYFLYFSAINTGNVSVIAPIAASSPALTLILARIFLKERLVFNQKMGVLMILAGIVMISV